MGRLTIAVVMLFAALALAGCFGGESEHRMDDPDPETTANPAAGQTIRNATSDYRRPVVAVVDSGINLYHEVFRAPNGTLPDVVDATSGLPAESVQLTLDVEDCEGAWEADEDLRAGLQHGHLYAFPGTRIMAIQLGDPEATSRVIVDAGGHGTAAADSVLQGYPDAIIVAIQAPNFGVDRRPALEWAAAQPWIDIVSVSASSTAGTGGSDEEQAAASEGSYAVVEAGKIYLNAAGNTPADGNSLNDGANGPPWALSISGADNATGGRPVMSGPTPDYVSDYWVYFARGGGCDGTTSNFGTSYSTPKAAGVFAAALDAVRRAPGGAMGTNGSLAELDGRSLGREDFIEAMQRAAVYWDPTDYDAANQVSGAAGAPILPGAPWLQMGWGYLDTQVGLAAAAHILGTDPLPEKPAAAAYMMARQSMREGRWGPGP